MKTSKGRWSYGRVVEGSTGPTGIDIVFGNSQGIILAVFSKNMGCMESNKVDVVAILKVLGLFCLSSFQVSLVVESDSSNTIYWVSSSAKALEISFLFQ